MEAERQLRRRRKYGSLSCYSSSPQVYVKFRPTTDYLNPAFRVLPDGKTLELQLSELSSSSATSRPPAPQYFVSDGVLQDLTQEELFVQVVEPVIKGAMEGVSGVILSLGPKGSGKNFSFYGDLTKFETRGLLPRAFEEIFKFAELNRNEFKFVIRVGMLALWKNSIRDLISLSPNELKSIGDSGPNGMLLQPIECAEHGYALLMRSLAGVKLTSDPGANYHTLIIIDIEGERVLSADDQRYFSCDPIKFTSRVTFAKIANLPQRSTGVKHRPETAPNRVNEKIFRSDDCVFITPAVATNPRSFDPEVRTGSGSGGCCYAKPPLLSETISVRQDLLFLEQMFIRMRELQEAHRCYRKVISKDSRMQNVAEEPEVAIPSQHFRQNKLCHCLRDLVSSRNEVRVLVHLRPELEFLQTASDALRFAARLRAIPRAPRAGDTEDKMNTLNGLRQEIQVLREELERVSKTARGELSSDPERLQLTPSHSDFLQQQALAYVNGKIEQVDVGSKAEAKALFENFRSLFQTAVSASPSKRNSLRKSLTKFSEKTSKGSTSSTKEVTAKSHSDMVKASKRKFKNLVKRKKGKKHESQALLSSAQVSKTVVDVSGKGGEEEEEEAIQNQEGLEGAGEFMEKMGFASKEFALEAFAKTEVGNRLAGAVTLHEEMLQESTVRLAEAVQSAKEFFKTVAEKEAEFDALQQERHARGDEYDISGNLVVPKPEKDLLIELRVMKEGRNQKMTELKLGQIEVGKEKSTVSAAKAEFDTQFELFCLEEFAGIHREEALGEQGEQEMGHAEFCNIFGVLGGTGVVIPGDGGHDDPSRNFTAIQRAAQEQAKDIVQYYRTKPPWRPNYK